MSAAATGRWRPDLPEPAVRPALFTVGSCDCGQQVSVARDRAGNAVQLDPGENADGEWYAVRVGRLWQVVRLEPGQLPTDAVVRYAEHHCPVPVTVEHPATPVPGEPHPGVVLRPAGRGDGLSGGACPARVTLQQRGCWRQRMCVRCGRVTPRVDGDGMPWCGGYLPSN